MMPMGWIWVVCLQHFAVVSVLQLNQNQNLLHKDLGLSVPGQSETTNLFVSVQKILFNNIFIKILYLEIMNKVYMDVWWVGWEVLYLVLWYIQTQFECSWG